MKPSSALLIVERRRYKASREAVFAAFTDPALLRRWFSPAEEIATEVAAFDLRVGGRYRFGFRTATEDHGYVGGEFLEITPTERLVYTWMWEPPDPHAGMETLVTVELRADNEETELTLRHERFTSDDARDRHLGGWTGALERLRLLNAISDKEN